MTATYRDTLRNPDPSVRPVTIYKQLSWFIATDIATGVTSQGRTQQEALAMLERMQALAARRYVSAYQTALVHVGLGDFDAGFAWLEKAAAERSSGLVNLCIEPRLDPIRLDARYSALVRRMRFPSPAQA